MYAWTSSNGGEEREWVSERQGEGAFRFGFMDCNIRDMSLLRHEKRSGRMKRNRKVNSLGFREVDQSYCKDG